MGHVDRAFVLGTTAFAQIVSQGKINDVKIKIKWEICQAHSKMDQHRTLINTKNPKVMKIK